MNSYFSDFTEQTYTKLDFINLILKRIRKDIRQNNAFDLKKTYWMKEIGVKTQLIQKITQEIFQGRLKLEVTDEGDEKLQISSEYLEEYLTEKLNVFFKGKPIINLKQKTIPILRSITFNELNQLKEIFKIKGKIENKNNAFIEDMQKKYDQTKTSMLKSFINLEHLS